MAKPKFDGVVEGVRYKPTGEVDWVRVYERRGTTFSDHVVIERDALIQKMKAGKKFVAGQRIPYMASSFNVGDSLRIIEVDGHDILVTDDLQTNQDRLEGVPLI